MQEIILKIKGVHFAVHPDYNHKRGDVSTEEMEQRTIERLSELDKKRPKVILVPEPDNTIDPKAVRAWCEGNPIGRVDADQTKAERQFLCQGHCVERGIVEEIFRFQHKEYLEGMEVRYS